MKLLKFRKPDCENVPLMLRRMADMIESGEVDYDGMRFSLVRNIALVAYNENQQVSVHGFGPEMGDPVRAAGVLQFGATVLFDQMKDEDF